MRNQYPIPDEKIIVTNIVKYQAECPFCRHSWVIELEVDATPSASSEQALHADDHADDLERERNEYRAALETAGPECQT